MAFREEEISFSSSYLILDPTFSNQGGGEYWGYVPSPSFPPCQPRRRTRIASSSSSFFVTMKEEKFFSFSPSLATSQMLNINLIKWPIYTACTWFWALTLYARTVQTSPGQNRLRWRSFFPITRLKGASTSTSKSGFQVMSPHTLTWKS